MSKNKDKYINKENNDLNNINENVNEKSCLQEDAHKENNELENELKDLKEKNKSLSITISNLEKQCHELTKQIELLNSDYVEKIKEKTIEAQKIIDETKIKLNEKLVEEVELKNSLYVEKNFSPILDCINQLNLIVNSNSDQLSNELKNYLIGFKMIMNLFDNALSNMQINKIDVNIGDKFDEKIMQAFEVVDYGNVESGCVSEIISVGYYFKDRVIKHTIVKLQK